MVRTILIGKSPSCDVVFSSPGVSRRHAELTLTEQGEMLLKDCHSLNGTFLVRGATVERVKQTAVVYPSDVLRLGDAETSVQEIMKLASLPSSPAPMQAPPEEVGQKQAKGRKLQRCACGELRVAGQSCPNPECDS